MNDAFRKPDVAPKPAALPGGTPAASGVPKLRPLCVDLDGTLVKSDTLIESITHLVRKHIYYLFIIPWWIFKGKAYLKAQVAKKASLDVSLLPFNKALLSYLTDEKRKGRKLYLVTGANENLATRVSDYLGIFDGVLASDDKVNLVGRKKAQILVEKFGRKKFAYAGNSEDDFHIWRVCSEAVIVNAPGWIEARARQRPDRIKIYSDHTSTLKLLLKAIRIHQCAKNLLLFAPIFLANQWMEGWPLAKTFVAFLIFTMCTSGVYLINDLFDLDADRKHPENKKRPLAAGDLDLKTGILLAPMFLFFGLLFAGMLSTQFFSVMLGYILVTTAYTFYLKQYVLADVIILASLYAWRTFAGAVAAGISLSPWFLMFAIFFFLNLALVKRVSELIMMKSSGVPRGYRRGYLVDDIPLVTTFGLGSGLISILVFCLFASSQEVVPQYVQPFALWFISPFLLYWIGRMWLIAMRGHMTSDPLIFAMRDRASYIVLAAVALLWLIAGGLLR